MDIRKLIEANKQSNRKVRQAIMNFNNYHETRKQWETFTYGDQARSWRRSQHNQPCPVCEIIMNYNTDPLDPTHPTIDHKHPKNLARHLALDSDNFWVICQACNQEKGGKTWTAYEYWIKEKYGKESQRYQAVIAHRPSQF